jgi:hypothetical protein
MIVFGFPPLILGSASCSNSSAPSACRSSTRRAAATRCCGSTCSGCSAIPRSTSSSCRRRASSRPDAGLRARADRRLRLGRARIIATGFLSFGLWVHHMFTVGIPHLALAFFSAASMLVAIPTGIQVFAWIATLWTGRPRSAADALSLGFSSSSSRRADRRDARAGAVRLAGARHAFRRRAPALRAGRRHVFPLLAGLYYWLPLSPAACRPSSSGAWPSG